jgi:hypothetical protein
VGRLRAALRLTGSKRFHLVIPRGIPDARNLNPPYVRTFQGGLLGTVGGTATRPGVPNSAVDATDRRKSSFQRRLSSRPTSLRLSTGNASACLPPVAISAVPSGKLHAPYFMQWSVGIEQTGEYEKRQLNHREGEAEKFYRKLASGCWQNSV